MGHSYVILEAELDSSLYVMQRSEYGAHISNNLAWVHSNLGEFECEVAPSGLVAAICDIYSAEEESFLVVPKEQFDPKDERISYEIGVLGKDEHRIIEYDTHVQIFYNIMAKRENYIDEAINLVTKLADWENVAPTGTFSEMMEHHIKIQEFIRYMKNNPVTGPSKIN